MAFCNKFEHVICRISPGSIAEELEIEPGDVLVSINGKYIEDVFDYRYYIQDEYIEVLIRKPSGEEWLLEVEKEYNEELGIDFENDLMSNYRSCSNKCIFCFIDQMPPGMRETLYFKDDDSRLSFLQGNYITLTNMTQNDVNRIIRMHLAPINISVQSTNPALRCKLLNNRFAGEKLRFLNDFYQAHIEMNGQIVLCKGVNDGEELTRTIEELSAYLPFMRSVSVVPAGITKYRDGLYPLELFDAREAGQVIDQVESYQTGFYEKYGLHFIHASDEWYYLAGRPFPEEERYDGYIQLENGVGMMRLLLNEFEEALSEIQSKEVYPFMRDTLCRKVSLATGKLAESTIREMAMRIEELFPNISVNVFGIRNDFFGETITVSGLITGQDLIAQLLEKQKAGESLGDVLLIPSNMLRVGEEVFLDDRTISDVECAIGVNVKAVDSSGKDFIQSILDYDYKMGRTNDDGTFSYIRAYTGKE